MRQVLARVSVGSLLDLSLSDMHVYTQPLPPAPPSAPTSIKTRAPPPPPTKDTPIEEPLIEAGKGKEEKGEWVQLDDFLHA